jgi:NAD+ kinase
MLKKVVVVSRPAPPPAAQELTQKMIELIEKLGVEVWHGMVPDEGQYSKAVRGADLVFALGGDGTILNAAKNAAADRVPTVGVDFGRFGFLAELMPEETLAKVPAFIRGEHWLEERTMLKSAITHKGNTVDEHLALNDIVIGRSYLSGVIDVDLSINGELVTTYIGDGLIVSTATGSTAYSLATGGPVLDPTMRVILLAAIAPHLSHLGHMVVPPETIVSLKIGTRKGASVAVDGQPDFDIQDKDTVTITCSDTSAYFARLQDKGYFYRTLANRLRRGG